MDKSTQLQNFGQEFIFMPDATRGAVRGMTGAQLAGVGTEALVVNTLHLLISPGPQRIEKLGGIAKFMNWEGVTLSDSGGFQVFSLLHTGKWEGKVHDNGATFKSPRDGRVYELTPERSIDIQMMLGTDILVVLDDCRKATTSREEAETSVARTIEWAKRCREHFDKNYSASGKMLTAVVQGANFLDLREMCAFELVKIGFDGYNFGGYLLDDDGNLVIKELQCVFDVTPADKFNYAMGVGKPEDIFRAGQIGYKVFDTVLPTRNARHGSLYVSNPDNHEMRIKNAQFAEDLAPIDAGCDCYTCRNHSRAYVHQMIKAGEMTGMTLATIHNLHFFHRLTQAMNDNAVELKNMSFRDILEQIAK